MDLSSIRIREHFGLIANDSHGDKFSFLISSPQGRLSLEKNDYVLVNHPLIGDAGQVLAVINEVSSYEEIAGSTVNDKKAKMLATAEIIGFIDLRKENRKIEKLLVPPNPGSRVYVPLRDFLEDVLNRNTKGESFRTPVQVGTLEGLSAEERAKTKDGIIKSCMDANEFTTKNTLISGVSGTGKTAITQKILTAIHEKATQRIIIIDPYDEYRHLSAAEFKITSKPNQESLLKESETHKIMRLTAKGLLIQERQSGYVEFLKLVLKLRLEEKIDPILLVVEEAEILKGSALEEAVTSGSKIKLALCLLTTHPSELGGKILSNISNQLIGKTIDAEDKLFLKNTIGKTDIAELLVGEWIINGVNRDRPLKTHVD